MLAALERAVDLVGGQSEFARRLNLARQQLELEAGVLAADQKQIKQQHVDYWMRVMKKLPAEHVRAAEVAVEGRVTRYEFRSDVFGPPPDEHGLEASAA